VTRKSASRRKNHPQFDLGGELKRILGVDGTTIDGIKVIRHVRGEGSQRQAQAFRMAAQSLSRSDSYLGARYRSLRGRLGGPKADKAMARYLACLVYRLLTRGKEYVDRGAVYYETKRREKELASLTRRGQHRG